MKKLVTEVAATASANVSAPPYTTTHSAQPAGTGYGAPQAGLRRGVAFILVPHGATSAAVWQSTGHFALFWQRAWLQANGIRVTVVTDDMHLVASLETTLDADHSAALPACCLWQALSIGLIEHAAEGDPHMPILLMPAPFLTDCDIASVLATHMSTGRTLSQVRGGQQSGLSLSIYIIQAGYLASTWSRLAPGLPHFAAGISASLPCDLTQRPVRASFRVPRLDSVSESRQFQRFWERHHLDIFGRAGEARHSATAINSTAMLAPTATTRGPVLIDEHVSVGDHARIGPWTVLHAGCSVGPGAWIEQAVIGAEAVVEPKGCVYRSQVQAGAYVHSVIPVLKALLPAGAPIPVLLPASQPPTRSSWSYLATKRLLDIVLALIALISLLPLFIVVGVLCLSSQGWPIFFLHERLGLEGKQLRVAKFRTMHRDAHKHAAALLHHTPTFKLTDDPRVTRLGYILRKTSIDELPQIFNVIRGGMSLVGPRPIVPAEIMRYGLYGADLLRVTPGMTGLWQVSGRSNTTYAQRIMLDVQYGDTCSLAQDLRILVLTLPVVLFQRGAV